MSEENEKVSGATYSEENLFKKIGHVAQKAGTGLIYAVLILYYTLLKPSTPVGAKMAILGALAYFISPVDLFPDFLPGGYTDDLGVLLGALVVVAIHIDAESKESARRKLHDWFGDYDVSSLKDIDEKLERKH